MALSDAFNSLVGGALDTAVGGIKGALNIGNNLGNTFNPKRNFEYNVFPEDLGSDYYGHWMTITAYLPDGGIINTPSTGIIGGIGSKYSAYTVGLFMPGGGESAFTPFDDTHEYTDIKVSNLMGAAIGAFTGSSGGSGDASKAFSYAGHPINPGVEVLYRSTHLRSFQFAFLFAPSSESESESLKAIIQKLRMFAAPDLNNLTNGILFDTPAEFVIKFFHQGQENTNIPKIRNCVLTNITVNYTPTGTWSTFSNGHPVSVSLVLQFQEMEIIHRKFIEDGY